MRVETIGDATRTTAIYALCEFPSWEPRYVGKTVQYLHERHKAHIRDAKRGRRLPVHFWIRKQIAAGNRLAIKLIEYVPEGQDWAQRETFWIERVRDQWSVPQSYEGRRRACRPQVHRRPQGQDCRRAKNRAGLLLPSLRGHVLAQSKRDRQREQQVLLARLRQHDDKGRLGMPHKEVIGDAELWLGDCMEVLPTLGKVDAVITDPPYGIGESSKKVKSRQRGGNLGTLLGYKGKAMADQKDYGQFDWDQSPPPAALIDNLRELSTWQAFFGGNYFALPPTSCWLVWDKLNGDNDFADCELCWTNWPKAVRRLQWRWNGMLRQGNEERYHPTQKPLEVMKWVLDLCPKADTVLDAFMGSGTTGVACVNQGRKFIGIEREPKYFDIACRRIEQAAKQGQLFQPDQPKPTQLEIA